MKVCWMQRFSLLLIAGLGACASTPKSVVAPTTPVSAHSIDSDGSPVFGAPEPEVVQLKSVETTHTELHVMVGNAAGDYALVCNLNANKDEQQNCFAPQPQRNYLLFRKNTKWLNKAAKEPIDLAFMQDWSVFYGNDENIGLMPAKGLEGESFEVFWLSSWTAKTRPQ
jgi:hypothetical protein